MTDDDTTDDDEQLKQLRSVWLSMRDEEPSGAGLSALMAAAHQQAAVMRPKESFWSRTLTALRRPPVLAFASIAILVGGAVVITQRKHVDEIRVVQETDTTVAAPAPAAESPPSVEEEAKSGRAEEAPAPIAAPIATTKRETSREGKRKAPAPGRAGAKQVASPPEDGLLYGGGGEAAAPPAPAEESAPASTRAPAPKPASSAAVEDRMDAGTPTVTQLVKQCETAAAANNCAAVRELMKKIAAQDPAQHKAKLATPAIARCF